MTGFPIYLDDVDTWPPDFREIANEGRQTVIDFQNARHALFVRRHHYGELDADFEPNPHRSTYDELLTRLDPLLAPHRIIVYHCTRLTPREADDIRAHGIRLLSKELVHRRLDQALADGLIDAADHAALKTDSGSLQRIEQTKGRWWGCPVRSMLRDTGVSYFFRTCGGEGIYFHLEAEHILPRLQLVGVPYIVVAAVLYAHFPPVGKPLAERFMAHFVIGDVKSVEPPPDFDFRSECTLGEANVIDLVDYYDPRFKQWTEWPKWQAGNQPRVLPRKT